MIQDTLHTALNTIAILRTIADCRVKEVTVNYGKVSLYYLIFYIET